MNYYALRVAPQSEFDVQRALTQREIPALVPREFKWRKRNARSGHRVKSAYALFPRYVFAAFSDLLSEYGELKIEEVQGVVCRSRNTWSPLQMSKQDVALVEQLAGREPDMTTVEIHKALKPGGQAHIILGPFAGQTVKIDKVTARKARVLLKLLNSMHVVEIPVSALDAA